MKLIEVELWLKYDSFNDNIYSSIVGTFSRYDMGSKGGMLSKTRNWQAVPKAQSSWNWILSTTMYVIQDSCSQHGSPQPSLLSLMLSPGKSDSGVSLWNPKCVPSDIIYHHQVRIWWGVTLIPPTLPPPLKKKTKKLFYLDVIKNSYLHKPNWQNTCILQICILQILNK